MASAADTPTRSAVCRIKAAGITRASGVQAREWGQDPIQTLASPTPQGKRPGHGLGHVTQQGRPSTAPAAPDHDMVARSHAQNRAHKFREE